MKKRWKKLLIPAIVILVAYSLLTVTYNIAVSKQKSDAKYTSALYEQTSLEQNQIARKNAREKWERKYGLTTENLLRYTNKYRIEAGLQPVTLNPKLNISAQNKANKMAELDFWSHNDPDGSRPWHYLTDVGYFYETSGENLSCGYPGDSQQVLTGWYNSPSHKANILNPTFTEVGFGIVRDANYTCSDKPKDEYNIIVQHFARPYGT